MSDNQRKGEKIGRARNARKVKKGMRGKRGKNVPESQKKRLVRVKTSAGPTQN